MPESSSRLDAIVPGTRFAGQFELGEVVGAGGYSRVFRARAPGRSDPVAIKLLDPDIDEQVIQRFYREALLTSALRHPNTLAPLDYGRSQDGVAYIVMELLEGESVSDVLDRGEVFAPERATTILRDVLLSLDEAHGRGIVHCDIKGSNIYLQRGRDSARVLDFGVAGLARDAEGAPVFGTPHYLAPELIVGGALTPAADIYSLAITAWEMLYLDFPFAADDERGILKAHVTQPFPELPLSLRRTPLGRFIARAAAKSPAARPTAGEAAALLESGGWTSGQTRVHQSGLVQSVDVPEADPDALDWLLAGAPAGTSPRPLVGMRSEVATVHAAILTSLISGGLVLVSGEAGAGKKRVVAEALCRGGSEFARVAFQRWSFPAPDVAPSAGAATLFQTLAQEATRRGDESLAGPARAVADLSIRRAQSGIFSAADDASLLNRMVEILFALAHARPLLLFVTEPERADAFSTELIRRLLSELPLRRSRLGLVLLLDNDQPLESTQVHALAQQIRTGSWEHAREVAIGPMSDPELARLARGRDSVGDEVIALLVSRAAGNPGKLLGMLRSGQFQGLLVREQGRLVSRLRADLTRVQPEVPRTGETLERLRRILDANRLTGAIAILRELGPGFTRAMAREALQRAGADHAARSEDDLERLSSHQILRRVEESGRHYLRFQLPLALFAEIGAVEAERLPVVQRAAAEALRAHAHTLEEWGRAADLFARIGKHSLAVECALRAGEQAHASGEAAAAVRYFGLACSEMDRIEPPAPARTRSRGELGLALARASEGAVGFATELLERVEQRARESNDLSTELEAMIELAELGLGRGEAEALGSRVHRMLELARTGGAQDRFARALLLVGRYSRGVGRKKEATRAFIQAERIAADHHLHALRAATRMEIARSLADESKFDRADALMAEAIHWFREEQRIDPLITSLVERGKIRQSAGDAAAAAEMFREAESLAASNGRKALVAHVLLGQARTLAASGDLDSATIVFLRALERFRDLSSVAGEAETLRELARCALARAQLGAARNYIEEAVLAFGRTNDVVGQASCHMVRCELAIATSDFPAALIQARLADERFHLARASRERVHALLAAARCYRELGATREHEAKLAEARRIATAIGDPKLITIAIAD